jgi:uncharacterized membrane protein YphA (DoxX/SURF4 family)
MKARLLTSVTLLSLVVITEGFLVLHDPSPIGTSLYPSKNYEYRWHGGVNRGKESTSRLYMANEIKKETTWERMTGPKLFKSVEKIDGIHSVPLVPLRILTGLLMIHHGSEGGIFPANFNTPEFQGFIDYILKPYFGFLPGPPELWSALHDYVEFSGGICFTVGFLTRPASLLLFGTMISAVYFHLSSTGLQGFPFGHVPNYSYDFEEPTLYAFIFFLFWFNGPVRFC